MLFMYAWISDWTLNELSLFWNIASPPFRELICYCRLTQWKLGIFICSVFFKLVSDKTKVLIDFVSIELYRCPSRSNEQQHLHQYTDQNTQIPRSTCTNEWEYVSYGRLHIGLGCSTERLSHYSYSAAGCNATCDR